MTVKRIQQKVIYFGIWEEAVGLSFIQNIERIQENPFTPQNSK